MLKSGGVAVNGPVIEWLLEKDNPSVRYCALTSLLNRPPEDPKVIAAKRAIMEEGIVPRILAKQNGDGSWGIPKRFYRDKYGGTVWNLVILAELAADPDNQRIKDACEFILKHSQEPLGGGFSYDESTRTGAGLSTGVIPCLTGNMVYSLIKLGCLNDERVQHAINWIVKYQRADDRAEQAPEGEVYNRYEMCWGRHSCHMGVAKALKALAAVPSDQRSDDLNQKIDELCEYFLSHHIYKKSHNLNETARPGWLRFGFPLMYQTDVVELLYIFAGMQIRDSRLADSIEIVKEKRSKDGKWKLGNSFNGKTLVDIEKKGQPSKWITLKALKILNVYS